jgi:hypothetical protein
MATMRDLRVGDLVEVRSAEEILATLDEQGELESLPFMPEMLQFCGQQFTVDKVALKLCDTIGRSGFRRMDNAVHLSGARCDGQAHGGCQAQCLVYWKTAWLRRVDGPARTGPPPRRMLPLLAAASRGAPAPDGTETYRCQATELLRAAPQVVPARDVRQYVRDVRSGNVSALWALRAFLVAIFNRLQDVSRQRLPGWLRFRQGRRWGFLKGTAAKTPTVRTDLRPGELVRVKPKREILKTLNADLLNRGMGFDVEMTRFCGRTARVKHRVERIIDEKTGKMLHMRHPCIVLEGVVCEGAYSVNCPRSIYAYWRELWLERVEDGDERIEESNAGLNRTAGP